MPDCQQKKGRQKNVHVEREKQRRARVWAVSGILYIPGENSRSYSTYNRPKGLHCLAIHSTLFPFPPVKMSWYLIIVTYRSPWAMAKKWSGLYQTKSCCSLYSLALIHHSTRHGQSLILYESGDLARARVVIVQRLKCWQCQFET